MNGQKAEALHNTRRAVGALLVNGRGGKQRHREQADDCVYDKEYAPAEAESREQSRGSPCGENRGEERCDCLDKLPEGQRRSQFVAGDKVGDKWVERGLHDGVADAEERERQEHCRISLAECRDDERHGCDGKADEDGFLASDAVLKCT